MCGQCPAGPRTFIYHWGLPRRLLASRRMRIPDCLSPESMSKHNPTDRNEERSRRQWFDAGDKMPTGTMYGAYGRSEQTNLVVGRVSDVPGAVPSSCCPVANAAQADTPLHSAFPTGRLIISSRCRVRERQPGTATGRQGLRDPRRACLDGWCENKKHYSSWPTRISDTSHRGK